MSTRVPWRQAYAEVEQPRRLMLACVLGIVLAMLFPTDLQSYRTTPADHGPVVEGTDHYLRFVNTAAQIALPLASRDVVGLVQLLYVGLATTAATHGLKFLVNSWTIWDVRLGERPSRPGSRYNMPSGHSSMASCAVYYLGRRFGWKHLFYLVPIMLLTMYARVELHQHTVSAVIAGMLIGLLMAAIFTGRRRGTTAVPVPAKDAAA